MEQDAQAGGPRIGGQDRRINVAPAQSGLAKHDKSRIGLVEQRIPGFGRAGGRQFLAVPVLPLLVLRRIVRRAGIFGTGIVPTAELTLEPALAVLAVFADSMASPFAIAACFAAFTAAVNSCVMAIERLLMISNELRKASNKVNAPVAMYVTIS